MPLVCPADSMMGVALNSLRLGGVPLHGLRHPPDGSNSGWYLWAGEYSDADDFFDPVHVGHLSSFCRKAVPYLALPPGWRFLLADDYEDLWYDADLLNV